MTKKKDLKKIPSHVLSRGMSLLNLTVSTGARYAGLKFTDLFSSVEDREKRLQDFFLEQATELVQELGRLKGSIMKAGQMLSVYGEHFFPPQINQILKSLQSDTPPVVWEEMEQTIRSQLGDEKYAKLEIDKEPIAAASMGQVYKARIRETGEVLALKVQYPGMDKAINSDLSSLKTILSVSHLAPKGSDFDEIFREIRMMLHYEVDYVRELEQLQWFQEKLKDDHRFIVPKVYTEFSTKRLLAMSYEEGLPLDHVKIEEISQERRNRISASFMELMFREIFEWRQVQTDPHFGNYKIRLADETDTQDRILLLDFGAVRSFPKRYIEPFAQLIHSALEKDIEDNFHAGLNLGFLREDDSEKVRDLFARICFTAIEPFEVRFASPQVDGSEEGSDPYKWGETKLLDKLTELAKDALFTFRLRPPPREAIFLDRKMVGTYTILTKLKLRMGPRTLLQKYLAPYLNSY